MKISKPKFLLREPKSNKETLIGLFVRFNNNTIVYPTGEKINPKNWDFKLNRAIGSKKNLETADINFWLDKIENEVKNIFRNLKIDGITPTSVIIKEALSLKLNDTPEPVKMTFFNFIEKYIQSARAIKKEVTIKTYITTQNHLLAFCKLKKITLDFDTIDMEFYNYFIQYLTQDLKHSQNTISKHIKTIKVFLNEATELGLNKNLIFKSKKFKRPSEDVTKIYLKQEEIDRLYNLDLSENLSLERVRDVFIIGCYTGLRFSDLSLLRSENIEGDYLRIKAKKTGETVVLPIAKRVNEIFLKYQCQFPKTISNQKMNDALKTIGEMAGINEIIIINKLQGGAQNIQAFKKFELLSCHCSRRSFATNAYLAGMKTIGIMKMTGHKSEKVFLSYIRFSQEENAMNEKNNAFFK